MGAAKSRAAALAIVPALALVLSACGGGGASSQTAAGNENADESVGGGTPSSVTSGAFTTSYEYAKEDEDSAWDAGSATTVAFDGDSAKVSGPGAAFSGGNLTIKSEGTYVLSGTLDNGQVLVEAPKAALVRLALNGVTLHNETGPAIYGAQSGKIVLILPKGTRNGISDGSVYTDVKEDAPDAAVFTEDDLSVAGSGTLDIAGNYKHGIRAQDILAITGGVVSVKAAGDALRGRDGVAVKGGDLALDAGGDGIQSNNADDEVKGFVVIDGGSYDIQAKNDGIQAQSALTIGGGELQIITGGGSANAPVHPPEFRRGREPEVSIEEEETVSMKALKAGKHLFVKGGEATIDAEDDALHSNGDLLVSAGKLSIKTGDDGLHADSALEIAGGEVDIAACYEGLEGLSDTISGGKIRVVASDDAVNAAGGADGTDGPMGADRFASDGNIFVRISGGDIDLTGAGDGIDANGDIFIEGGSTQISGPSRVMEGAIDFDGDMTVTGGKFITAGSVINASQESAQPVILLSYTQQQASGAVIAIKDGPGKTLLEYKSKTEFNMSGFTSPDLKIGETYSLFVDGQKRIDIRISGVVTAISDDGGEYDGRRGRHGGAPVRPVAAPAEGAIKTT